jgi:hypothetical protein
VRSAMADVFAGAAEEEAERALAAVARGSDGAHEEPHPVASGADLEARVAPLLQVPAAVHADRCGESSGDGAQ